VTRGGPPLPAQHRAQRRYTVRCGQSFWRTRMMEGTCATCMHWVYWSHARGGVPHGECHRFPPKALPLSRFMRRFTACNVALWPIINSDNRCGEYRQNTGPSGGTP